jgi:hypothetical protein
MTTRYFENPSLGVAQESILSSTLLMNGFAARLCRVQVRQPRAEFREGGWMANAQPDVNNIGQCLRWGFAIEGGMALVIYAGWALCRHWM